ncbi:MAG: hypothetical protein ACKVU0_21065 [Saprospiraceae bacterium]
MALNNKSIILLEEFKIVYDMYKALWGNTFEIIKYYTSTVLIVIGGVALKVTDIKDGSLSFFEYKLIKSALVFLIVFGGMALLHQIKIIKNRNKAILQLNYLRDKLFESNADEDLLKEYSSISKYKSPAFNISTINPIVFYIVSIIILLSIINWLAEFKII